MEESAGVQGASKEIQLILMQYIVVSFMLMLSVVAAELPPVAMKDVIAGEFVEAALAEMGTHGG